MRNGVKERLQRYTLKGINQFVINHSQAKEEKSTLTFLLTEAAGRQMRCCITAWLRVIHHVSLRPASAVAHHASAVAQRIWLAALALVLSAYLTFLNRILKNSIFREKSNVKEKRKTCSGFQKAKVKGSHDKQKSRKGYQNAVDQAVCTLKNANCGPATGQ